MPGNTKNAHPKIFMTTVMEKKKNINFKVIKNKEREAQREFLLSKHRNNFLHNQSSYDINNFEKNNKIFNNYNLHGISNNLLFMKNVDRKNIKPYSSSIEDHRFSNKIGVSNINENLNNFDSSLTNINKHISDSYDNVNRERSVDEGQLIWHEHEGGINTNIHINTRIPYNHEGSNYHVQDINEHGIKKSKYKESYTYLEFLINAADKFIKKGYYIFENTNNNTSENDEVAVIKTDNPLESHLFSGEGCGDNVESNHYSDTFVKSNKISCDNTEHLKGNNENIYSNYSHYADFNINGINSIKNKSSFCKLYRGIYYLII